MSTIENIKINNITVYAALITFFIVCFYCIAYILGVTGLHRIFEPEVIHLSIISLMATKMVLSVYGRQGFVPPIWLACCLSCAIIWGLFLYFTGLTDLINRNTGKIIIFVITLIVFLISKPKIKNFIKKKPTAVKVTIISYWALFLINPFNLHIYLF
jgi:hypothetical protein